MRERLSSGKWNKLGKVISKQSFAICNKIKEIVEFPEKVPEYKNKIAEGHPEVYFAMHNFNGGFPEPVYENKKLKREWIKG